jgi:hypothetical protein
MKALYGPDIHFGKPDNEPGPKEQPQKTHKISPSLSGKWYIEGYMKAFSKEIRKLERKYKEPSGQRFVRSFQFFKDACRLENPHYFVASMTSLESLFCTTSREITFQVSSRVAWFLHQDDPVERKKLFDDIKDLYDIRSKIVHGDEYSMSKVEDGLGKLEGVLREVFYKILSEEKIFGLFTNENKKLCDDYLNGLNLGLSF